MEIIGHCRFSWYGISDTGRELINRDDAKTVLWHPTRMAMRFFLFESFTLPSLRAQTDQNFRFIILISEDFPQVYQDALKAMVAQDSNIEVYATPKDDIGHALRPIMMASFENGARAVHFRLDDDDALCTTYIERLRSILEKHDLEPGTAISFPRGVTGFMHGDQAKHIESFKGFIAIGLAFVADNSFRRNPFQFQHKRIATRLRNYVDPTFLAYHYTRHLANTTIGYADEIDERQVNPKHIVRILRNHPNIAAGEIVAPELDTQIDAAFQPSSGAELRSLLKQSIDGPALRQKYGFD